MNLRQAKKVMTALRRRDFDAIENGYLPCFKFEMAFARAWRHIQLGKSYSQFLKHQCARFDFARFGALTEEEIAMQWEKYGNKNSG